jgi:Immunoglobulin domain
MVQQAPEVFIEPAKQRLTVTEGDEISITCSATGIPQPTVVLSKTGSSQRGPQRSSLVVHRAEKSDAGVYECTATSEAGSDTRYVQVYVKEKRGDVGKWPHSRSKI